MANLFQPSVYRATDDNGDPVSGALLYAYLTGTTVNAVYYLDQAGETAGSHPLVSDADGVFPLVFLDPPTTYRIRLTDADGNLLRPDIDPVRGYDEGMVQTAAEEAIAAAAAAQADAVQTAADRVQTGIDRTSTATSATEAAVSAVAAGVSAGQAIAATATAELVIQQDPATPTVPPAGVADGERYWATDTDGYYLTLYLNTTGTGAPVLSGGDPIQQPLANVVNGIIDALPGVADVLNSTTSTQRMGVSTLTAGDADYVSDYTFTVFKTTRALKITGGGIRIAAVGSGALKITLASGDPLAGNLTFISSTTLPVVGGTGNYTFTGLTVEVAADIWVCFGLPSGGVTPRRRGVGVGQAYSRTPELTTGSGAFSTTSGNALEAYIDIEYEDHSIERISLSPDIQSILTTVDAAGSEESFSTGFGGPMSIIGSVYSADGLLFVGTAPVSAPIDTLTFRATTVNSGISQLIVMRGDLADRPAVVQVTTLPTFATNTPSFTSADMDDYFLTAGDHVFIASPSGGPTLSRVYDGVTTMYFGTGGVPLAGLPCALSTLAGNQTQARFTQTAKRLPVNAFATPTMWDIFLIAGQSNAVGKADGGGPTILPPNIAKQYYSSALTDLTGDPVGNSDVGSAWPAFANEYYQRTGRGVIFVPTAVLGSGLQSASAGGASNTWSSLGTYRGTAITQLNAAKAAATSAGMAWQFAGVLWCQGESDAASIIAGTPGVSEAGYVAEFAVLYAYFCAQTSNVLGKMPMLIVRTGTQNPDTVGTIRNAYASIRSAQDTCTRNNEGVFMAFTGAVNFVTRGLMKDPLHYTQPAYNEFGVSTAMVAATRAVGSA